VNVHPWRIFSGERYFWRESLLQGLKSPWALFLTKRVPVVVEIRPADWPEKYFSGQSAGMVNVALIITYIMLFGVFTI